MARLLVPLFLLAAAGPLGAQEPSPWRSNYFPYLIGNPATGPMLVAHFDVGRQADYDARVVYDGIFSTEAGLSAQGSKFVTTRFRAPLLRPGWRLAVDAGAVREARFGYDPIGREIDDIGNLSRVHRTRFFGKAELSRQITGPLWISAMGGVEQTRWSRLPGLTAFRDDFGPPLHQTDAGGRLTLVFDTRDKEYLVSRGVFAEAGLLLGSGGEHRDGDLIEQGSYAGWYAHLRGYLSPRSGTVVAARLAARSVDQVATLQARNTLPGWEGGVDALGGAYAHRSFVPGRESGRGLLLGSFEVRHNLLDVGDYGAITLLGFVDGGRVFEAEDFSLTTRGWKVGGGGGVALRVLRASMLTFNFAGGPDGFVFSMGTGWSF